jgi:hypothetical protein
MASSGLKLAKVEELTLHMIQGIARIEARSATPMGQVPDLPSGTQASADRAS